MGNPTMSKGDVARLLGRAAFGATKADLDEWTGKNYADLVAKLVDVPATPVPVPQGDEADRFVAQTMADEGVDYIYFNFDDGDAMRAWWLDRMRTTSTPLVERMTLFWHTHFATAARLDFGRPSMGDMARQNDLLRKHALGNFKALCEEITLDPAMLFWLNGAENRTPEPNENYARELLELFTLGRRPQVYTERDIREAARALTGWTMTQVMPVPRFDDAAHDKGTKKILGTTVTNLGAEEYKKVVEIALKQKVSPLFIAYKLVSSFAYVPSTKNLVTGADPLVKAVAGALKNWDVKAAVRTMLLSDHFRYAAPSKSQQSVRQPVEAAVHAAKVLGKSFGSRQLLDPLDRMGQILFQPPNVGGWPKGSRWITPVTTLGRYELAQTMANAASSFSPTDWVRTPAGSTWPAADNLKGWADWLGLPGLAGNTQSAIRHYLARTKGDEWTRQSAVFTLIFCSPDWVVM